ncbi:MAG: TOMM precursor leader peptide-binding protein [Thermaerobacter sp.]|nr:TOMM precursor leader peptide-binding protein [Thermaerobacter sp.]
MDSNKRDFPTKPFIAPWYQCARTKGGMLFKSGNSMVVFEGKAADVLLPVLLPLLDGTRSVKEIHECVGEAVIPATQKALDMLHDRQLLSEGSLFLDHPSVVRKTMHFLQSQGGYSKEPSLTQGDLPKALVDTRLGVIGAGLVATEVTRLLKLSGVETITRLDWTANDNLAQEVDLVIVAPREKELNSLREWNKRSLSTGISWMQVLPFDGRFGSVGPHYVPAETACYKCYLMRLASNVDYRKELAAWQQAVENGSVAPPEIAVPLQMDFILACVASFQVLLWIAAKRSNLVNRFCAIELGQQGMGFTYHNIYRVPRCPECSCFARQGSPLPWYEAANVNE